MKIAFSIVLSTLCLTYSAIASANENKLVEKCVRQLGYVPTATFSDQEAPDGYRIESFRVISLNDKYRLMKACISTEFHKSFPIDKTKMADVEYHQNRNVEIAKEFGSSYEFLDSTNSVLNKSSILDKKNKIRFDFFHEK
ncbi:hypothetical protein OHV96_14110 [Acinetobacter baumannii]|nr:hypothetical protein [Acinetobacter baumannii]